MFQSSLADLTANGSPPPAPHDHAVVAVWNDAMHERDRLAKRGRRTLRDRCRILETCLTTSSCPVASF